MCGRFTLDSDARMLITAFGFLMPDFNLAPRYNIAPGQPILGILELGGQRLLKHFHWGLIPHWAKDPSIAHQLINARSETAHEKASFKSSLKYHRLIIPATGFYEWQKKSSGKQPMYIHRRDGEFMAFAGLWAHWQNSEGSEFETATILTTQANSFMKDIHARMPVILPKEHWSLWLDEKVQTANEIRHLMQPCDPALLSAHPVSKQVNSPAYDDPILIHPKTEPEAGEQMGLF